MKNNLLSHDEHLEVSRFRDLWLTDCDLWHGDYEDTTLLQKLFWSCVKKTEKDACWLWQGELSKKGYGYLRIGNLFLSASHISWKLHYGGIPKGMWILHKCDNPPCVNPEHLWSGTHSDNIRDSIRKGRFRKTSEKDLLEIKKLLKLSFLTQKIITKLFNISFNLKKGFALDKDWSYSKILLER